jgi:hypothetical protein
VPITPDKSARRPHCAEAHHCHDGAGSANRPGRHRPIEVQLARYRRAEFGRSSEQLARDTEQLELALEALETDQAERLAAASPEVATAVAAVAEAQKPARRPLPQHLPREDLRHPAPCTCPSCGGALRKLADEVSETLDYVPGRFKVIRRIREKLSAGFATQWWWWRRGRRITRSPAAAPARRYWLISWCRNTMTACRSTARPRSSPTTG